ncbi:MAG: hypothetical protein A3I87_00590 [Candidatus Staskawiczbacteria bacterium RIFCSPLOWO2_02_FULL_39_8]|nr:MAG: hypothetical protein A3I87_00590 [Candidatus Staskawiczbacteria bacterium RIFCSPLOWO2_02_FULL_39_8]
MAVAPNANIGLVAGTTPGIDPRFAQVFSRNKISGKYLDINHNLVTELKNMNLWDMVKDKIIELQGDISSIEQIPPHIREIYKTSFSVSPYAFIEVAARAQKWVDQALSRNMYLEDRDMDKTMDIYYTAWRKGVKSTYYLHMKPRHTAEQSTVAVNKSAKLGKTGFAAVFKKTEAIVEAPQELATAAVEEPPIEEKNDQPESFDMPQDKVNDIKPTVTIPVDQTSKQIFSNVQTQIPLNGDQQPAASDKQKTEGHFHIKVINGKEYKVHMPSDPQEKFLCDGCQ